jgi:hypothetical protein
MTDIFSTKDASYQADIGIYQGTDFAFFGNTAVAAQSMRNWLRSEFTITEQATDDSVLLNSLFSPGYGNHMFSAPTGQSKCSMGLPVPSTGMKLRLDFMNFVADANISVFASTGGGVTGVSLVRATGSALSSFEMSALGWIELACVTDGEWSIVGNNASLTVRASS